MANVFLSQGVMRGDRIVIYMPMIPEAAYAMLACARIGAIHSVVFAGFSPDALANRVNDCGAKLVVMDEPTSSLTVREEETLFATVDQLKASGQSIGLTTVYRNLQALADAGQVDVLRTDSGESVYRHCSSNDHHHHLVCRECGTTVEVQADVVEQWATEVAAQHGFVDISHTVEVFGRCGACS